METRTPQPGAPTPTERFAAHRRDFPSLSRTHHGLPLAYFDGPGGTQVPQRVLDAMMHYYRTCNANTHGYFVTTLESDEAQEEARARLALFLGASSPRCISFGHNMTSLNFALARAVGRALRPGDEVLVTQLDHEANRGPWLGLRELGVTVREIRLLPTGALDMEDAREKIGERTRLVAAGYSSNFIGTVNDIPTLRKWTYEVGAWLSVDAVHYAPHFPLDVTALGVDFLLCSAYKFYGPHVGVLYAREDLLDQLPTDRLRTQDPRAPHRIETGTLNPAAIVGAGAAVDYLASLGRGESPRERVFTAMEEVASFEHVLAAHLWEELGRIPGVTPVGLPFSSPRRAPTVSFTVEGKDPAEVCRALDERAICAWDGHFYGIRPCEVMGLLERGGVTRVGLSLYNTEEEVERLLAAVREIASRG